MSDLSQGQNSAMLVNERTTHTTRPENERRNIFEDVAAEENAFQFVGSANGHTTTARRVTARTNASQCLGDISDTTIQQISKDRNSFAVKRGHFNHGQPNFEGIGRKLQ
ncbi:hypothetical protein N7540_011115 [Penicillium herquei]|nr:hypothetical protein N7540_011115 [Penicillium herquei]